MINLRWITTATVMALALGSSGAPAATPDLKSIMQGLRNSLVTMTDGLLQGEPEMVAQAAANIANHSPVPEHERSIIRATLGTEMPGFAELDREVHVLSVEVGNAAEEGDLARAERDYQTMVAACLACHTSYKARVSEALKAARPAPE